MNYKIKKFFPFENIRPQQEEVINFALDTFLKSDKKFAIIEAPTGSGKSGCGITIAKYLAKHMRLENGFEKGAWFITTQKTLQDQYMRDFSPPKNTLYSIKSASNYQCEYFKKNKCSDSLHLLKEADPDSKFYNKCYYGCCYKDAKRKFLNSELSITNFPYFLTESTYIKKIVPRQLLICDEAHNVEAEISSFFEILVSEKFASGILDVDMPTITNQDEAVKWVKEQYKPSLYAKIESIKEELRELQYTGQEETEEARKVASKKEKLDQHRTKINKFLLLYSKDNWVFNLIPSWNRSGRKLEFKTIDISQYSKECLFRFGQKILLMSATILDKDAYCESVGIDPNDAEFISIDSTFPKDNMPVYFLPSGDMSKRNLKNSLPIMTEMVKEILSQHKNEKGIIHTRTFNIANYIKENIKSKRLIVHSGENREEVLEKYLNTEGTVLVSPSHTEGLDLKDDLSRFQIICKIYWPYLGDELVKRRMKKYKHWYSYQAVKSLIQARGRSIRTEKDYAATYILDDAFDRLYSKNLRLFPEHFKKCLFMP